jgi:hypothetical protein
VLNGKRTCVLPFPIANGGIAAKANGGAASKAASHRGGAAPSRNNSVILQNRSRVEPFDDDDWGSDKEHDEEPAQSKAGKVITRKVKTPADKTSSGKSGGLGAPQTDSNASCLHALKDWRKKVSLCYEALVMLKADTKLLATCRV